MGETPVFNALLWVYGLPTLLLVVLARRLAKAEETRLALAANIGALVNFLLLVTLEVRQAFRGSYLDGGSREQRRAVLLLRRLDPTGHAAADPGNRQKGAPSPLRLPGRHAPSRRQGLPGRHGEVGRSLSRVLLPRPRASACFSWPTSTSALYLDPTKIQKIR